MEGTGAGRRVDRRLNYDHKTEHNAGTHRSGDRGELLLDAARRGVSYLKEVNWRRVAPGPAAIAALERLRGPLPEKPTPAEDVLALLDEFGSPATVTSNAGGTLLRICQWRRRPGVAGGECSRGGVGSECCAARDVAGWHCTRGSGPRAGSRQLLGLPEQAAGALVTGSHHGQRHMPGAARHALLERKGWDVEARGLFGAPEFNVVIGEEAHASLKKAMAFVGLGRERVHLVPTDEQGRMCPADFPFLKERRWCACRPET